MTLEEARKVCEVLASVDGNCPDCAEEAAEKMVERFPEFPWVEMVKETARARREGDCPHGNPFCGRPGWSKCGPCHDDISRVIFTGR